MSGGREQIRTVDARVSGARGDGRGRPEDPPRDLLDVPPRLVPRVLRPPAKGLAEPYRLRTLTAAAAVQDIDQVVRCNAAAGPFTVTLPPASQRPGRELLVKKIDGSANAVTIAAAGTDTIEGAATLVLGTQWAKAVLVSHGAGWEIF